MSHLDARTEAENKTYYIKEGDRKPVLELILYNEDGTIKDLTSLTPFLVVASCVAGRRLSLSADGEMSVDADPTTGIVQYAWQADELVAGEYLMEVILDLADNSQETFPKGSYYKLIVVPHL